MENAEYSPHCPRCGDWDVRYADTVLRSRLRQLTGSRKRHCAACGAKWHIEIGAARSILRTAGRAVIVACSVLTGVLFALASSGVIQ